MKLRKRKQEVLELMADGKQTKEIAEELNISPHTVSVHRAQLYQQLGVIGRTAAVVVAWLRGWIK